MRTLLLELRPGALSNVGLADLLHQLADATTGRARIPVALQLEGEIELPTAVKTGLFHVAQEALNNVVKHARATQASIVLHCALDRVQLAVCDDGVGFDPTAVPADHLGLSIMYERAQEIEAQLSVESKPGEGTCILARWERASRAA
jgi:signal transduction histidine kinase